MPRTAEDDAVRLTLAGVTVDQVSRTTDLTVEEVDDAVRAALELRHPGLTLQTALEIEQMLALWRRAYADGVQGDAAAAKVAVSISQELRELRSRAGYVPPADSPAASIRDGWSDLALGAVEASAALRELVRSGRSESVRQRAAATLLSRVGVTERVEVAASVRMASAAMDPDAPDAPAQTSEQVVRDRLAVLGERRRLMQVIDAEVVDAIDGPAAP